MGEPFGNMGNIRDHDGRTRIKNLDPGGKSYGNWAHGQLCLMGPLFP